MRSFFVLPLVKAREIGVSRFLERYLKGTAEFTKNPYMSIKILVVDDNEDLLQITQIILKAQGYDIFTAATIEDAARKVTIHQPTLILLDVSVCEKDDGRTYCQQLKEEAATKGIRVILMSGNEYDGAELGNADDFLQKPFDFAELTEKVSQQTTLSNELPLSA